MKSRFGKTPAMMTVELGVSLVLIVIVLFVVIGLFNDNIKSMISSSNFSRMFSANGLKTWFQSFGRNYDDSQIYVQIMGEQGLEMLRMKANNNSKSLIDNSKSGGKITSPITSNTIMYLAKIINIIVGNREICEFMKKPSKETCTAQGLDVEYIVNDSGITIKDTGALIALTNLISAPLPTSIPSDSKEKLKTIQTLATEYKDYINSSYAMTTEINNYVTTVSSTGSTNQIEAEIINLLGSAAYQGTDSVYKAMSGSSDITSDACKDYTDSTINTCLSDLSDSITSIQNAVQDLINNLKPSLPTTAYLPSETLPVAYTPTINSDNSWYSASVADADIIEGSEDALVITTQKDDPLSLLAPEGEEPILESSEDASTTCTTTFCQICTDGGGSYDSTSGTCDCSANAGGSTWMGNSCGTVVCSGSDVIMYGVCVTPTEYTNVVSKCTNQQYYSQTTHSCVSLPAGTISDYQNGFVLDGDGVPCISGYLDAGYACVKTDSSTGGSTIIINPPTPGSINVTYNGINASFDAEFVNAGTKYMSDYYMSRLKGTSDPAISARIKVLTVYNDMMLATWSNTIIKLLIKDTSGTSCSKFKNGLIKIATNHGLTSFASTVSSSTECTP